MSEVDAMWGRMMGSETTDLPHVLCAEQFGPVAEAQCGLITLAQARGAGMTRDQCRTLIEVIDEPALLIRRLRRALGQT
jgi:hypothetical protein